MTIHGASPLSSTNAGLEVIRLDRTGWRISDSSIDEGSSDRLLGYIERLKSDRFEVLWLAAPIGWAYVASFELALAAVADRLHFSGIVEVERDPVARARNTPLFHRVHRR